MARRWIGLERLGFALRAQLASILDELGERIEWSAIAVLFDPLYPATKGEPVLPPLTMFELLSVS